MKRFLKAGHGKSGAGTWDAPVWRSLKAAVFCFCLLAQVCGTMLFARNSVFAADRAQAVEARHCSGVSRNAVTGTVSAKKIVRKIKSENVKLSKTSYTYDGHAKKPSVTVTYARKKLKKNRDYTVTYKNNKKRGTASVIVRGRGNYSGTVTKTFRIR